MSLDAARIWLPAISSQHQASLLLDAANGKNTDCFVTLPDLEVPMINSLVSCLAREHLKLDEQILQLTLVATRLAANPNDNEASAHTTEVWEGIQRNLWSHLQIEDELVLTWGEAHHALRPHLAKRSRARAMRCAGY